MSCARPNTARSNPYDLGELEKDLRDRLYTLFYDAPDHGLTLVSGYRDPGRQWDLRHERVPGHECDSRYKGYPVTAVPAVWNGTEWVGGSKHQHRKAADIGGRALQWAIDNRARYGVGLTVLSENWHFEAHGRDARTRRPIPAPSVRILTYPGKTYDNAPPPVQKDWFDMADKKDLEAVVNARIAPLEAKVNVLYDQIIGSKAAAGTEALRQLWRDTAADADAVEKRTRP